MNAIDAARTIYSECLKLQEIKEAEERFKIIRDKCFDFTIKYPLIVKYMCVFFLYNEEFFKEFIEVTEKLRPDHLNSLKFQAIYLKNLLISLKKQKIIKSSLIEINKIVNLELNSAEKEFNKILSDEKKVKKTMISEEKDFEDEKRKEFLEFLCANKTID